jgi:hypothetical protein
MRLLTYDRGGARRLGAWVGGTVVDVPDAVGHPAFPTTLEALVARNGGTTLDAARAALGVPEYLRACAVPDAAVLPPLVPPHAEGEAVIGTGDELPWPREATAVECRPELACVIGRAGRDLSPELAMDSVFGYTIVNTWTARIHDRRFRIPVAVAIGPFVATVDTLELGDAVMDVVVNGRLLSRASLAWSERAFARTLAEASVGDGIRPGELYAALAPGANRRRPSPLSAGAVLEVEVSGLGRLRTTVGRPGRISRAGPAPSPTTSRTRRSPRPPALRRG